MVECLRGWRPLFDDAAIAWRSWDVFSGHSPLVGHMTALNGSTTVYGLGPLQNWLLAVPVRIDPVHGALWGAAIVCGAGIALGVEAGWSVGGWAGGAAVSAAEAFILLTRPDLALDPLWNPTMGVVWLVAALAASWAAGSGRLGWWPVSVLAASVSAQCHEVFAATAMATCLLGGVLGVAVRRGRGGVVGWRWIVTGAAVGIACWAAPLVQEVTGRPGNLTLLWDSGHGSSKLGLSWGMGALAAAVRPFPDWWHIPVRSGREMSLWSLVASFKGPKPWAAIVLVLLFGVAVIGWRARRYPLAVLASVGLAGCITAVWSVSRFPWSGALAFRYLNVIWWPVGMVVFLALGWGLVEAARALVTRRLVAMWPCPMGREPLRLAGAVAMLAIGTVAVTTCLPEVRDDFRAVGGWQTVGLVGHAVSSVERVAPRGPFALGFSGGPDPSADFAVVTGVAYGVHVAGYEPRVAGMASRYFGPSSRGAAGIPSVVLHLSGGWKDPWFRVAVVEPKVDQAQLDASGVNPSGARPELSESGPPPPMPGLQKSRGLSPPS